MNPSLGWGLLPEGWWSWDGTTGLWVVMNSLWNGSKSGWGDWVLAEEIVAMVGAQLGQVGLDSVLKGEKLHLQPTLSSGTLTANSVIFTAPLPQGSRSGLRGGAPASFPHPTAYPQSVHTEGVSERLRPGEWGRTRKGLRPAQPGWCPCWQPFQLALEFFYYYFLIYAEGKDSPVLQAKKLGLKGGTKLGWRQKQRLRWVGDRLLLPDELIHWKG